MEADASSSVFEERQTSFEEDFISHFERLPELWNVKHMDYKNKLTRHKALNMLLLTYQKHKPDATVDDVRKKINSLRSNYRRELRKVAELKLNGIDYLPKARSYKMLSFLYDTEQEYVQEPSEDQYIPAMMVKYETFETTHTAIQPPVSPINEAPCKKFRSTAKPIQTEVNQPSFVTLPPQNLQIFQQPFQESTSMSLAYIWSQKLEKMDNKQRLFAEKAINDVLFEAEMGNLHRHSVKINESEEDKKPGAKEEYI